LGVQNLRVICKTSILAELEVQFYKFRRKCRQKLLKYSHQVNKTAKLKKVIPMNTLDTVNVSNKKTPVKRILQLVLYAFMIFTVISAAFGRVYYIQCSEHGCGLGILQIQVKVSRLES